MTGIKFDAWVNLSLRFREEHTWQIDLRNNRIIVDELSDDECEVINRKYADGREIRVPGAAGYCDHDDD